MGEDSVEYLSVTLIQEIRNPKKDNDFPFIESGICIDLHIR
jgi:hypothetical protein